ncbi:alpha-N-arabinofuranosidase [Kluyvera genomosp. 2]|uniref:alpha-N-arabinofuranosidase n=1 Tax=Kluyvera genomosp. 2 TaxID=2774054 RepID=UPI002FD81B2A
MKNAHILFDRHYVIGDVSPRLMGSFVEHLGRCLYNGLYEPEHPQADAHGFRQDVKALMAEAGISGLRYPGGNFVSGYRWLDGVGPQAQRPVRKEMAWRALETNAVGTNEFAAFTRDAGIELIMACNLGTGTPMEAGELVDYCNTYSGTAWAELRRAHGVEEPHDIRLWCLGNEMDGKWQISALTAEEYARKAREAAKIIKWMDPQSQTIACGSCTNEAGHLTFGEWDRIVLEACYDDIDYLSLHRYLNYRPDKQLVYAAHEDERDIPWLFSDLRRYLDTVIAACDFVKGRRGSDKSMAISFDEWGVVTESGAIPGGQQQDYGYASFSQLDAVVYGGVLCTFLNYADRVKIACQSLLVNEGGMISTQPGGAAIRQTTFYPFRDVAHHAKGVALKAVCEIDLCETGHHGQHVALETAATFDADSGRLAVFIANHDLNDDYCLRLQLNGFMALKPVSHTQLQSDDYRQVNSFERPDNVVPVSLTLAAPDNGQLTLVVLRHSWNMLIFELI